MFNRDACRCGPCRDRDARAFWAVLLASYSPREFDAFYPGEGRAVRAIIARASREDVAARSA